MVPSFVCACNDGGVAPSHLCSRHCSNFFRADACDVSSIQASQHQKMGLRGNNCWRLDFNCDDINSRAVNKSLWELASTAAIGVSFAFIIWRPYCCLCLIVICVSYNSIALKFWCGTRPPSHGAATRQRKLTVTIFIMTIVSLKFAVVGTRYYIDFSFFDRYTQSFFPDIFTFQIVFYSSIPHKLAC